jgi:hypothetical protein
VKRFCIIIAAAFLAACAPNLAKVAPAPDGAEPVQNSPLRSFRLYLNDDSAGVSKDAWDNYARAAQGTFPEKDSCTLDISLDGHVKDDYSLPLAFIPIWPVMRRNTDMTLELYADLLCKGDTTEVIYLLEEEHPHLFWYGPYRSYEIQKTATFMHTKLAARLRDALIRNTAVDTGSASDF